MRTILLAVCVLGAMAAFLALPHMVVAAPLEEQLLVNQKIFYYHVPAAMVMFASVFVCGVASIGFLKTRNPRWDDVAMAGGDLTVLFGALVLTSGPIWGKAAWGVYWAWDVRLTQSLLLWLIFVAYALLRRYGGPGSERLAAGLGLFGMVNVPMVYFAVNLWKTQHPTNNVVPNLKGEMLSAFLVGLVGYVLLYIVLLVVRISVGRAERRLQAAEDLAVEAGVLE